MNTVRVTVVADARDVWGSERSILQMAPVLAANGVRLRLAAPADGDFAAEWKNAGLTHIPLQLPVQAGLRARGAQGYRGAAALVAEAVATVRATKAIAAATYEAQVIHSNNILVHPSCAAAGRLTRRPVVLEFHDLIESAAGRRLLGATTLTASAAIAISSATAASVGDRARRKVRLLPQAVDTARFCPGPADPELRRRLAGPDGGPVVGIIGRVDPEKGVLDVVRAMELVHRSVPTAGLVVVGRAGQDSGRYLDQVVAAGRTRLGARFTHLGHVADVPGVLHCLDLLVNASSAEPFGLSVLEAQACGVAVVAAAAGGLPDFVLPGRTGLLFEVGDIAGLAAQICRLLKDPALAGELTLAARNAVAARHSVLARAAALADIYRDVARSAC